MKSITTKISSSVTRVLRSSGKASNDPAFSLYGPVRVGLTTTHIRVTRTESPDQQLTELLNSLERKVEILVSKSSEVLDTSLADTTHLVEPIVTHDALVGTNE